MAEQPFTFSIPHIQLDILRQKLELTRLPDELDQANWDYGAPLTDVRRLTERWLDGFDFKTFEETINSFPQFTRDIDVDGHGTLNIHYVHQESKVKGAIPLLFAHGWPGHFMEVAKILPLLTTTKPGQPSFHVVALSLPGFGFSEGPKKKGFAIPQYAETAHKLMLALGYNEYVAQGGDWGFYVCRKMAQLYGPTHVKAWHTNFPFTGLPSPIYNPLMIAQTLISIPFDKSIMEGFSRINWYRTKSQGYFHLQTTQPQTIGYALADSPVGLLAWIYEKLVQWTDGYPWTDDEVLSWVSMYWFSRAGPAASVRIYYETQMSTPNGFTESARPKVPVGLSYFPKEIIGFPKCWTSLIGNVVHSSDHTSGGHFAAFEKPEELVGDLRAMFGKDRGRAFGVVSGRNGYAEI